MKKGLLYLLLALFGLSASIMGCHLIFPFSAGPDSSEDSYFCSAQIYRALPGSSTEFTEEWEHYTWAYNSAIALSDCTVKIGNYINEYMAPGFTWSYRNLTAAAAVKEKAYDCPSFLSPPTYGAPFGAELVWNSPPATQASVYIHLVDKDGVARSATPSVANAYADFAERTGLPDGTGTYVLGKRHIRISDLSLKLSTPFSLGSDLTINTFYIQSIGTIIGEDVGANLYKVYTGDAKFFFYAHGSLQGESAATSTCFINDVTANITQYQGPPNAFFTLSLNLLIDMGTVADMNVRVSLSKPTSTYSFYTHQPFIYLNDKSLTSPVDLSPDIAFDHDNNLDDYLWFEDFEASNEKYLGAGNPLNNVNLSLGAHDITVVAYDTYGGYNSDTMTLTIISSAPSVVWVDDDYTPASAGGHTYGVDAFNNIEDGIYAVASPGTVHVAAGDYVENITMKDGVQILGAGSAFTTIDGDESGPVVQARWVSGPARLEGFTITNGSWAWGGGIHIQASSPTISNCEIIENSGTYGGGLYCYNGSPTLTNCIFWHNSADEGGGMIFVDTTSAATLINCTLSANVAEDYGGGIYNYNSSPTATNCILWGNMSAGSIGNEIYDDTTSSPTITYSDIQGGYSGGFANIDSNPLFLNEDGGNLHLRLGSRCIDKGTNAAVPVWLTHDIGGHSRKMDGDNDGSSIVDMGAYEVSFSSPATVWVDDDWAGTTPGSLVHEHVFGYDAFEVIQDGIDAVASSGTVYVAEGIYPENIELRNGVTLWGSEARATTIDGDENGPVVRAFDITSSTILHGFSIVNGRTDGIGGGIYNSNSSLTITNCIFRENVAENGGAIGNDSSSPTIINCTFWYNTAHHEGNNIWNDSGSAPTVTNSILWGGPASEQISGGSPTVTYCAVELGHSGAGNTDEFPLLAEGFHLEYGSPCIDTGSNLAVPIWLYADFDGEPRISDGDGDGTPTVDMGVDEFPPCYDNDGDGFGDPSSPVCEYPEPDCDDNDNTIYPGATESCDDKDNDCDPGTPDGWGETWLFQPCDGPDTDLCEEGEFTCVTGSQQCGDSSDNNVEICDDADNDCDPSTQDGAHEPWLSDPCDGSDTDFCEDGTLSCIAGLQECDDATNDHSEICDGADNDCDGSIDEGLSEDIDGDNHYAPGSCFMPADDCNDNDNTIYPGAAESCDDKDNDCDPGTPDGWGEPWFSQPCDGLDTDLCEEGSFSCVTGSQLCDDTTDNNLEFCDGADNDCDPTTQDGAHEPWLSDPCDGSDTDFCEDGTLSCIAGLQECDDTTNDHNEVCDGTDNDCDGSIDEGLSIDSDGDNHYTPGSCFVPADDCDDNDNTIYPGAPELSDNKDNDCDGHIDECLGDLNDDGHVDGLDMILFANTFGSDSAAGDPHYNPRADFDANGKVDKTDLIIFASHFGKTNCPQ